MIKDIFFFPISTDEDLSYVLEFSGLDLSGRSFQVLIKDRASGTTRATLTNGSGITITGTNVLEVAYAKDGMTSWPRGEYTADVVDITSGANGRIMAVRFLRDLPGRLVGGVKDRKAFVTWGNNTAVVTATGAIGPAGPVGLQGDQGIQGEPGADGADGDDGTNGWTPELAVVSDGARRVQQVVDWVGGTGTKPDIGDYVGAAGLTPTIGDAIDIRGPAGTATIPDGDKGDVTTSDTGDTWLLNASVVKDEHVATDAAIEATKLAFTPAAGVSATDVQGAIEELAGDIIASRAVSQPEGRLSLTSGDPTPVSDVAGATTIYYVPAVGIRVPVYDGSNFIAREFPIQLSLALDATSGHTQYHSANTNFDVFAYWTGSALAIGAGPAWTAGPVNGSNTARGSGAGSTELEVYLGRVVNKNAIQLRIGSASGDLANVSTRQATYLGSFRAVAAGQTSDTKTARLLFNAYNQIVRRFYVTDGTASHTYSTAAFTSYNGSTSNRVTVLCGLSGVIADILATATFTTSTTTYRNAYVAIGLDSTTSPAAENVGTAQAAQVNQASSPLAFWKASPGLGYHEINWLYSGSGTDTQTWLGTSTSFRIGMTGTVTL